MCQTCILDEHNYIYDRKGILRYFESLRKKLIWPKMAKQIFYFTKKKGYYNVGCILSKIGINSLYNIVNNQFYNPFLFEIKYILLWEKLLHFLGTIIYLLFPKQTTQDETKPCLAWLLHMLSLVPLNELKIINFNIL